MAQIKRNILGVNTDFESLNYPGFTDMSFKTPISFMDYDATAHEHVLITTTQLLCLYIEIKNNPSCAEERIKELLSCVGKYQRYSDYQSYLTIIETDNV